MRKGMSGSMFSRSLAARDLSEMKEEGIDYVELDLEQMERYGPHVRQIGLPVRSAHMPFDDAYDLSSEDREVRRTTVHAIKRTMEVLRGLGGRCVVIHPSGELPQGVDRRKRLEISLSSMEALVRYAGKVDVLVAVENLLPSFLVHTLDELRTVVGAFPEEHLGICLDTGHAHLCGNEIEIVERCGHRIVTTHLSDNYGAKDDHLLPLSADIDWRRVMRALHEATYTGPLLIEADAPGPKADVIRKGEAVLSNLIALEEG